MRGYIYLIVFSCLLIACKSHNTTGIQRVNIETPEGDILVELYADKAPKTVAAFLAIVENGIYENSSFYRVLNYENQPSNAPKAEFIQGGLWSRSEKRPDLPRIPHEDTRQTTLKHLTGSISMARELPGSATSEFFICLSDQPGLDYGGANNPDGQGYAVFGKVIRGMDVVRKIFSKPESEQYFDPPVPIYSIEVE
jgi:peptidyl-prolyl cis-trans isomerase A (cyclophilin A)